MFKIVLRFYLYVHLCPPHPIHCTRLMTLWEFKGAALKKLLNHFFKKEKIRLYWTRKKLTKFPILNFIPVGKY